MLTRTRAWAYVLVGVIGTWCAADMFLAGILTATHMVLAPGPAAVALNALLGIGLVWLPIFRPLRHIRGVRR
jgi:uncharacterized paraquat-inducible protein A